MNSEIEPDEIEPAAEELGRASKEALLTTRLDEADVPIPGVGTVRVRAMTRQEVHGKQEIERKAGDKQSTGKWEAHVLQWCLLDPALSLGEVRAWMMVSPAGEISKVVDKILELSGLDDGADKSDLSEDGDEL